MKAEFDLFGKILITTKTNAEHYAMRKWLEENGGVRNPGLLIHINIPTANCQDECTLIKE